jgi:predicted kinase
VLLIVFSGLPGSGKTTIALALAAQQAATYLRIDTIEQAIRNAEVLGRTVVADCVNPVVESRAAWQTVANRTKATLLNIEILCSDPIEHRRRVETRISDITGLTSPTWQSVQEHEYERWEMERLVVDTASVSPNAALELIERHLAELIQ